MRRLKNIYFSNLKGLGEKLEGFLSDPSDRDNWTRNLKALSALEMNYTELMMYGEFRDMFDDFLVFHKMKGNAERDIWREETARAAKQKLIVVVIWEAYSLLQNYEPRSSEWIWKVESFIDDERSNQEIIFFRLANPTLEAELSGLLKEAAALMLELKEQKKHDYLWHQQFKRIYPKLERAAKQ
ncbi:hypothetical protein A8L34_27765 [Bacillus sp. FJAT-27264]|uniref:hypothetical protein n=1 Tax=Paenibacillus sp. (strain DSM 101736 / FJAT-27264) TaxID=1850362 RepID=UPI000807BE4C|nr:hypothetical protein [Bacillus sp. FJAT-27264]OBZ15848.1 hypothetical protein A8L34_27765 [Bacillus sp. FJAT-27264]